MSQRRTDAAVLMAETSLLAAGRDIATADRYQVIVSMEASEVVRKLSPTTYRFRVFDADGRDIRVSHLANVSQYSKTCIADTPTQHDSRTRQNLLKPVETCPSLWIVPYPLHTYRVRGTEV